VLFFSKKWAKYQNVKMPFILTICLF